MIMKQIKKICKTCKYWKGEQAELAYSYRHGICVSPSMEYTSSGSGECLVLDRKNGSTAMNGTHRFENVSDTIPIGKVSPSRYAFVTEDDFGCIHHKERDIK